MVRFWICPSLDLSCDVKFSILPFFIGGSHHLPICLESDGKPNSGKLLAKRSLLSSLGSMYLEADFHTIQAKFKDEIKAATFEVGEGCSPKYWWNKDLNYFLDAELQHGRRLWDVYQV